MQAPAIFLPLEGPPVRLSTCLPWPRLQPSLIYSGLPRPGRAGQQRDERAGTSSTLRLLFSAWLAGSLCPSWYSLAFIWASLVAQMVKRLPAMRETWVRSLGWEDPLEKEMAAHSSIFAWRIPWTEEPVGLQSTGLQRVGHDRATSLSLSVISAFS